VALTCKSWYRITASKPYWKERTLFNVSNRIKLSHNTAPHTGILPDPKLHRRLKGIRVPGANWADLNKALDIGLLSDSVEYTTRVLEGDYESFMLFGTWKNNILGYCPHMARWARISLDTNDTIYSYGAQPTNSTFVVTRYKYEPGFFTVSNSNYYLWAEKNNQLKSVATGHFKDYTLASVCAHPSEESTLIIGTTTGETIQTNVVEYN